MSSQVVDPQNVSSLPETAANKPFFVEVKWFWVSVQMDICASEKLYMYKEPDYESSPRSNAISPQTPGSRSRKRKRLKDTVSQLAAQGTSPNLLAAPSVACGLDHRRRSSISEATFLSLSGSFLDAASPERGCSDPPPTLIVPTDLKNVTPRHQVYMELLHTEMNYVEILDTIISVILFTL